MRVVVHDEQAGVDYAFTYHRDVVEHVGGLLDAGCGIDVPSEFRTYLLEIVEHGLAGQVLRAVEAHVLEKVGQSVLVRSLLDGAYVRGEVEFRTLCRLVIVSDVVCQTVFQFSLAYSRVVGQRVLPVHCGCRQEYGKQ